MKVLIGDEYHDVFFYDEWDVGHHAIVIVIVIVIVFVFVRANVILIVS